jgi:hypothetical protein
MARKFAYWLNFSSDWAEGGWNLRNPFNFENLKENDANINSPTTFCHGCQNQATERK